MHITFKASIQHASRWICLTFALTLAAHTVTVVGTGEGSDSALIVLGDTAPDEP